MNFVSIHRIICLCIVFLALPVFAVPCEKISDISKVGTWTQHDGYLQNKKDKPSWPLWEHSNLLVLKRMIDCKYDFHAKAKMAIVEKKNTAASFMIGQNNFVIDGPYGHMIMEGADFEKVGKVENTSKLIRPGAPFIFECIKKGNLLEFKINGKKIADTVFYSNESLPVALRPHRGIIRCYDFNVIGKPSYNAQKQVADNHAQDAYGLTAIKPICLESDATVRIPLSSPVDSTKGLQLKITSLRDNKSVVTDLDGNVHNDRMSITTKIPSSMADDIISKSAFNLVPVNLGIYSAGKKIGSMDACIYKDKPTGFPDCKIERRGGNLTIVIDGKPLGTMQGYLACRDWKMAEKSINDLYKVGVRQFKLLLFPMEFMRKDSQFDMDGFFDKISNLANRLVIQAPDARIHFQLRIFTPKWWAEKYPDQVVRFDKPLNKIPYTPGDSLQPSYASPLWRRTYGDILKKFVKKLSNSYLADRVIGIRICYANCGEWNNWGYHAGSFPDFSSCMNTAFEKWLVDKYGSTAGLQKAWHGSTGDMKHLVPTEKQRLCKNPYKVFRDIPADVACDDYYDFWQWFTVDTINYFAKAVKEASQGKILCGAYYGYYVGHLGAGPYHFQDSGHYGVKYYLKSPYLDFIGGPDPYSRRRLYGCLNSVFSSISLNGKLWVSENDQRTDRSALGETKYGRTDNVEETIAVFQRDFMNFFSKGASYYYFDFAGDWLRSKKLMAEIDKLKKIENLAYSFENPCDNEVAVFVSEDSIPYYANNYNLAGRLLQNMLECDMDFTGAPWDFYLMSDLGKVDFKKYKLVIFANAFYVPESQRSLIRKKVMCDNRNIVFMYACGMIRPQKFDAAGASSLTGIDLKAFNGQNILQVDMSAVNEKLIMKTNIKLMSHLPAHTKAALTPLVVSSDPAAKVLGYINGDKSKPGVVEKQFDNYTVLWVGFPMLNVDWLKNIYGKSGVHSYIRQKDIFYKRGHFYCIYSRKAGTRKLRFKTKQEFVINLLAGKVLAKNVDSVDIKMLATPTTVILYAGPMTEKVKQFLNKPLRTNNGDVSR